MKRIILGLVALNIALFSQSDENIEYIKPKQFKVDLLKNCEVLMLNEKRDRKSKRTHTSASNGDCVQNMGCIRDITQKELEGMQKNKRQFAEWKTPVWCKVSVGSKEGWVQRQYLADKPCDLDQL